MYFVSYKEIECEVWARRKTHGLDKTFLLNSYAQPLSCADRDYLIKDIY